MYWTYWKPRSMRLTLINYVLTHNMSSNLMNSLHRHIRQFGFDQGIKLIEPWKIQKEETVKLFIKTDRPANFCKGMVWSDSCIKRAFYRTKRWFIFLSTKPNYWWNSELSYCPEGRRKEGIKKEKACLRRKRSAQIQILALESTLLRDVVDL